jgi:hypothetical protein
MRDERKPDRWRPKRVRVGVVFGRVFGVVVWVFLGHFVRVHVERFLGLVRRLIGVVGFALGIRVERFLGVRIVVGIRVERFLVVRICVGIVVGIVVGILVRFVVRFVVRSFVCFVQRRRVRCGLLSACQ